MNLFKHEKSNTSQTYEDWISVLACHDFFCILILVNKEFKKPLIYVCATNGFFVLEWNLSSIWSPHLPAVTISLTMNERPRPVPRTVSRLGRFLKCQDEEKREMSIPCITGPHRHSEMFFVHAGVWFSVFCLWAGSLGYVWLGSHAMS